MRRLPPLTALRVFEAVGRAGNVRLAAQELNVTPAAISHQVRLLEEYVGAELFTRTGRGLILTSTGSEFFHNVSDVFDRLAESVRKIGGTKGNIVRVHSLPSFASCWLVPRLTRFFAAHPKIEVEITSVGDPGQPTDLAGLGADFAIRVGVSDSAWPGVKAEKLIHEDMFPVCAPELLNGSVPLHGPQDLALHTLLHVSRRAEGWPEWLAAAKAQGLADCDIDPNRGPKFDTIQMSITAATQGMGIAMGRLPLVEDHLKSGALIAPFSLHVRSRNAYWLLSAANTPLSTEAATFRNWLQRELTGSAVAHA